VELRRNPRPPQHVDAHPDPGGAHAVCPRSQTIRRGQPDSLPREMAGGTRPYRKRKGSRYIYMPRPDPTDLEPGYTSHMPPHYGTATLLPGPTTWRTVRRSLDPNPPETPPHITGDSRPNATAQSRHTSVWTTTRWPHLGNPNPEVGLPPPPATYPIPPWEPAGIGTTHEVAVAIITTSSPAIHGPMHSGRRYTSS